MEVLNSYRLASARGIDISLYISGNYDTGSISEIIAHPDAVNQNRILISGANGVYYDTDHKIKLIDKLYTSYPVSDYSYYLMLETLAQNIRIQNLKLHGFITPTNSTTTLINVPTNKLELSNVEILGTTHIANEPNVSIVELADYVAFSNVYINIFASSRFRVWGSEVHGTTTENPDGFTENKICGKIVFKNIKGFDPELTFAYHGPFIGARYRIDIILDNIPDNCTISNEIPGVRYYSGDSEYYYYIYCKNKEDLKNAFPSVWALGRDAYGNPTGDKYNKVIIVGEDATKWPSWYNPNWDQV